MQIWLRTDCIWITVATKQYCSETFYHKSELYEVLTGYLSLGRRSGGDWTNPWQWTECFTVFFWNSKQQQPQLLPRVVLVAFLKEAFITNIIITLRINYIIMFINNNAVFNNNYGRRQDLILLFKIPMGSQKNHFENL